MLALALALLLAEAAPTSPPAGDAPAFEKVIKGAKATPGQFTVWTKDASSWFELAPAELGKPFIISWVFERGTGEGYLYPGFLPFRDSVLATFRLLGGNVQLVTVNARSFGTTGGAREAAQASFSESLIGSAPVASKPGPGGKILVALEPFFVTDALDLARSMEEQWRQPYALDAKNSHALRTLPHKEGDSFLATLHYAIPREVIPPLLPPGAPTPPVVIPPLALDDVRSLFVGIRTNFRALAVQPLAKRAADERLGTWITTHFDFDDERLLDGKRRIVNRWRLEKKDPQAALSKPVKPIVFWLDKNIPPKFRGAIRAGALEWNKAFETAGFQDALEVREDLPAAEGSILDGRHAALLWFTPAEASFFGYGPHVSDPRSGEIVDAKVMISQPWLAMVREHAGDLARSPSRRGACDYGAGKREEFSFAFDVLEARGGFDPEGPEAQELMLAALKDLTMHEVGHTLGLRHNFRGSMAYTLAQLSDPAFTRVHALGGSVMDYTPGNLAAPGEKQGEMFASTIGAYDKWVIEYLYRPFASADEERAGLAKITGRSAEPELGYGTDDDIAGSFVPDGRDMDPSVTRFDLGSDQLAHARRRLAIARELFVSLPTAPGRAQISGKLRFRTEIALRRLADATHQAAKLVGGVVHVRDRVGGRTPFTFVPAAEQRAALELLNAELFAPGALTIDRRGLDRLQIDFYAREDAAYLDPSLQKAALFPWAERVTELSTKVLDRLLGAAVLARVAEGEATDPNGLKTVELFAALDHGIWAEARDGKDVIPLRRALQREHTRRLASLLLEAPAGIPEDVRTQARQSLLGLQANLRVAAGKKELGPDTKAHFVETLARVDESLSARMERKAK